MRNGQYTTLEVLRRCRATAEQHLGDERPTALALLDDVLARIGELVVEQRDGIAGSRAETRRQRLLIAVLRRHHLKPLVRALRDGRLAPVDENRTDAQQPMAVALVTTARRVAASAEACQKQLVAAGLPPDFLAELLAVAAGLEDSLAARERYRAASAAADPAIAKELCRGRHALDAIESAIRLRHAAQPDVVAAWVSARRRNGTDPTEVVNETETSTLEDICIP